MQEAAEGGSSSGKSEFKRLEESVPERERPECQSSNSIRRRKHRAASDITLDHKGNLMVFVCICVPASLASPKSNSVPTAESNDREQTLVSRCHQQRR